MVAVKRGEREPARRYVVDAPEPKAIRAKLGLSQADFARLMGVSPRTVQNWEQKRRRPEGSAMALLRVTELHPEMVLQALHGTRSGAVREVAPAPAG